MHQSWQPQGVRDIFGQHAFDRQRGYYAEAAQAIIRICIAPAVALYIAAILNGTVAVELTVPEDHQSLSRLRANLNVLLYLTMGQAVIACGIMLWILKSPTANSTRRIFAIANDYVTITAILALGGPPMAPIFVLLLWLTIGSGLRYGPRYLVGGALASMLAMVVTIATNSYWQAQPFVAAALVLVAILVPAYIFVMLRTMRRASEAEQVANQAKSQFLAVMSHELRAPLTGIIAMTQMLLGRRQPASEHEVTQAIKGSAESLLLVVDDLLDVSTSDANRIRLNHEDFQIKAVAARLEKILLARAREKRLALSIAVSEDVPSSLRGDQHRLTQVLLNLLHNAIKCTDKGSITLAVSSVSSDAQITQLRFDVRGTGKGVRSSLRAHIFEPFAQENASLSRRHGEISLGTTIACNLVEQMGGATTVDDGPGGGVLLSATIPFEHATLQPEPASDLVSDPGPFVMDDQNERDIYAVHRETTRALRILSVEDQRPNRIMLQSILNKAGHRPVMCADPERALNYLVEEQFDLVILDVHMPSLSGIDIVRRLRELESDEQRTPVLFLTADMTQETVSNALAAGGMQVLTKPICADHLLNAITKVSETYGRSTPPDSRSWPATSQNAG